MYARKFAGRHLLDDHRWTHTCEHLFVCELWGKWDKCSIYYHKPIYTGVVTFSCSFC